MERFEVLKPECYHHFTCKGGECRLDCCSNWSIHMSQKEFQCMRKKDKTLENHVSPLPANMQSINRSYEMKLTPEGECPFLTEERLCKLQSEHGADILSSTCQMYPRHYHRYLNKLELGLSLGCEKTLELLFDEKDGLKFVNQMESIPDNWIFITEIDGKKRLKTPAHASYYDIQSLCLGILQAQDSKMEDKLIILGMALFRIDQMAKEGAAKEIPNFINRFLNDIDDIDAIGQLEAVKSENLELLMSNLVTIQSFATGSNYRYGQLAERIKSRLKVGGDSDKEALKFSAKEYSECQRRFSLFIKGKEHFMENIAVAFMFFFNMPFHNPENGVWKDYTYFVWVYTMTKFVMTTSLDEDSTVEEMIDCCTILFRKLCHSRTLYEEIVKELNDKENNSVAHMAIFLKSC